VSLVAQELLTLPENPSSHLVLAGVHVTRSLVLYVCFVDRCLSFFFCYLQTLLIVAACSKLPIMCILRFMWAVMYLYCMVEVIGHVFVCIGYRLSLFLRFFYWILELFVFVFLHFISYYVHLIFTVKWYISIIKCSVLYYTGGLRKRKKYLIEYDSISQRVRLWKSHLYFNNKTLTNRNELIKPSFDHLSIYIYLFCRQRGKRKGKSYPRVPVIVADRSEYL
jgi:hypothetical protein